MADAIFTVSITKRPDGQKEAHVTVEGTTAELSQALAAMMQADQKTRDVVMSAIYNLVSSGQAVTIESFERHHQPHEKKEQTNG